MVFTVSFFLVYYFLKIFFAGEGYGKENFPKRRPFIVVFNHNSYLDLLCISLVVDFRPHGMGKHELFNVPLLGWWLKKINVHPIIRNASDKEGFERFVRLLRDRQVVFISPEGTRKWQNGRPPRPRTGFVRLAQMVRCPVVPLAIYGTREILPPGEKLPRWHKIIVRVGKPLCLDPVELKPENHDLLQRQANQVMAEVYKLLPPWARPKTDILEQEMGAALVRPYAEGRGC